MSKTSYIFLAVTAIFFMTLFNYSTAFSSLSSGTSGSRTYVPGSGGSGGFSGGHK